MLLCCAILGTILPTVEAQYGSDLGRGSYGIGQRDSYVRDGYGRGSLGRGNYGVVQRETFVRDGYGRSDLGGGVVERETYGRVGSVSERQTYGGIGTGI